MTPPPDHQAREYLLGGFSPDDQVRLEQEYFADDARFEGLLAEEEALIDDYLHDALDPDALRRFETHSLGSPERRAQVDLARQVRDAACSWPHTGPSTREPQPAPIAHGRRRVLFRWAAAAALVLLAASSWSVQRLLHMQATLDSLGAEHRQAVERATGLAQDVARERAERQRIEEEAARLTLQDRVAVLPLRLAATRSAALAPGVQLRTETQWVRLVVDVTAETAEVFWIVLKDNDGTTIRQWEAVRPGGATAKAVTITAPANLLRPGRYELTVSTRSTRNIVERLGDIAFDVHPPTGHR